jgi:hypothetical protein
VLPGLEQGDNVAHGTVRLVTKPFVTLLEAPTVPNQSVSALAQDSSTPQLRF